MIKTYGKKSITLGIIAFGEADLFKRKFKLMFDESINFVIHYNKLNYDQFLLLTNDNYFKKPNIYLFSEHEVYWGDISILDAQIFLAKKALECFDDENIIVIDNRSLMAKSWEEISLLLKKENVNFFNISSREINTFHKFSFGYRWKKSDSYDFVYSINKKERKQYWQVIAMHNFKNNLKYNFVHHHFTFWKMIFNLMLVILTCFSGAIRFFDFFTYSKILNHNYYLPKVVDKPPLELRSLNILGPSMIIKRNDLIAVLNHELYQDLYKFLLDKHAPEETFFYSLFYDLFKDRDKESLNPFWCNKNNTKRKYLINKKYVKFVRISKEPGSNYMFYRRISTHKEIDIYEKTIKPK